MVLSRIQVGLPQHLLILQLLVRVKDEVTVVYTWLKDDCEADEDDRQGKVFGRVGVGEGGYLAGEEARPS